MWFFFFWFLIIKCFSGSAGRVLRIWLRTYVRTYVCPEFSWELAHWIFLIFCMKLGNDKQKKVTEPDFSGKIWFSRNLGKSGKKCHFWQFLYFGGKSYHGLDIQMMFKWKILWYWIFLCKPLFQEKSASWVMAQKLLANQMARLLEMDFLSNYKVNWLHIW